ncbi:MAG: hypothetical protein KA371_11980 [Acidobacteria bacterium]|nr:hypothetical protein [Acidobacteriota bacterium]
MRRPMTRDERAAAVPRFPWSDLALAPLSGLLAAVPAVVLAGLPLYLFLWLTGFDEPGRWVRFVAVAAFGVASAMAIATTLGEFLRARARIDDDLLEDEVEERVMELNEAIGIVTDPPVMYLRGVTGETVTLRGDYVADLRDKGDFPSTFVRLVQLPRSRAVVSVSPVGEPLTAAFVAGLDHRPTEIDGYPTNIDFERLRGLAR